MGILRLLFAISVFTAHGGAILGHQLVNGAVAVQCFFVISGFYISLVLTEKYGTSWSETKLFYSNRLLRLYPAYWCVLVLTLMAGFASTFNIGFLQYFSSQIVFIKQTFLMQGVAGAFAFISNLTLFGIDWTMFMKSVEGKLQFAIEFGHASERLDFLMPLPQAWSLGIEIAVYLMAPILFRMRTPLVIILIAATFIARWIAFESGLNYDPWTYRFLPFELGLFLMGTVAYRIYARIQTLDLGFIPILMLIQLIAMIFWYSTVPNSSAILPFFTDIQTVLIFSIWLSMPFIFAATKSNKLDRLIGDLSYPFYVSHLLMIWMFDPSGRYANLPALLATFLLSIVILIAIDMPVEKFRQMRHKIFVKHK